MSDIAKAVVALFGLFLMLAGLVVIGYGLFLQIGNLTGRYPTFPFAGLMTMVGGCCVIGFGVKLCGAGDEAGRS